MDDKKKVDEQKIANLVANVGEKDSGYVKNARNSMLKPLSVAIGGVGMIGGGLAAGSAGVLVGILGLVPTIVGGVFSIFPISSYREAKRDAKENRKDSARELIREVGEVKAFDYVGAAEERGDIKGGLGILKEVVKEDEQRVTRKQEAKKQQEDAAKHDAEVRSRIVDDILKDGKRDFKDRSDDKFLSR